jgi:chromosome segregation ATPase
MSVEAAEALEKIKASFDTIEKNVSKQPTEKQESSPELARAVNDMNDKLKAITTLVEKHKVELNSYEGKLEPQSLLIESVAKIEQSVEELNRRYDGIEESLVDLKQEVNEASEKQLKHQEMKLIHRIESLESALALLRESSLMNQSENKRLFNVVSSYDQKFVEFGTDIESEQSANDRLVSEVAVLSKRIQNQDKLIEKILKAKETTVEIKKEIPAKTNSVWFFVVV